MTTAVEPFDLVVLGAGLRGLTAALRARKEASGRTLLVVDRAAQPGGSLRTQRTNGYVCELGAFAFTADELAPLLAVLDRAPAPIAALPTAGRGAMTDGVTGHSIDLDAAPLAFRTGNEELVQACRRELGQALRLGRDVTAITAAAPGEPFTLTLGGEVPSSLLAHELVVALPTATAGRLLGAFDPGLAEAAARVRHEQRAFVWFGGDERDAPELTGYGLVPAPDLATPCVEVIFCTQVFAGRALPGRFLVRCELVLAGDGDLDDASTLALAERELRRWTGCRAAFGLQKVHTTTVAIDDGALVECRSRLRALPARVPGLRLA